MALAVPVLGTLESFWATDSGYADLKLPGMPRTKRGVNKYFARVGAPSRRHYGPGGGTERPATALPREAQRALAKKLLLLPALPPGSSAAPDLPGLKHHQAARMEARATVLSLIDALGAELGTRAKAIDAFLRRQQDGTLPAEIQRAVPVANARAGAGRRISRAGLFNWLAARDAADGEIIGLAPAAVPEAPIPAWAPTFMELYGRPSKPNIAEALENWPPGEPKPSYDQARRLKKRIGFIECNKGRHGPRALRGYKAYIQRDVSNLWPGAVFIGDGHTFKAEVAHPLHGQPFRPEITAILDVFTRRWVGWSAALAENTWSVADALRHAVTSSTCCDVFYYDNGSGAKNQTWDDAATGLIARLGITKFHSAPWSSQARGVIERFNSSVLHKSARRLPTYVGQRMDDEARQHAYRLTRRDLKAKGASRLLISWPDFLVQAEAARLAYNQRPHGTLPRTIGGSTGKRRHQTPDEAWGAAIAQGWTPEPIGEAEARDLFRPAVTRLVRRAQVELFSNIYFNPALEALHGETVTVAYDIHDAGSVQIRLPDGRYVCDAKWDANKRDYLPVSFVQRAHEKRIEGQLKRLDAHRDRAIAARSPTLTLLPDPAPQPSPLLPEEAAELAAFEAEMAVPPAPPVDETVEERKRYTRYLDLCIRVAKDEPVGDLDRAWHRRYAKLGECRVLKSMYEEFGDDWLYMDLG